LFDKKEVQNDRKQVSTMVRFLPLLIHVLRKSYELEGIYEEGM